VTEPRFWRAAISKTFHGRDIFAPVAAHLSLGIKPAELGPPAQEWAELETFPVEQDADGVHGVVEFIDPFGNLITNIPASALPTGPVRVAIEGVEVPRRVSTYADVPPGTLVALVSSSDRLEIAISHGSAAAHLGARVGDPVHVIPADERTAQE
jgi:S-adenosylmethionine hydrolase